MPQILKEEIKNRIYKAASKIFYKKGFLKTKMKDISEEAKIPVGLVYTYYKNKEELFDEIVNPIYYYLNLAIEKEEKGLDTIKLNAEKFNLDNFELIHGKAPDAIPNIAYDRMFIGGSTGGLEEIINHFLTYAKDEAILVINGITLETQSKSLEILKEKGFKDIEVITVTVGRAKRVGPYTMMFGENPICIIKVIKRNK